MDFQQNFFKRFYGGFFLFDMSTFQKKIVSRSFLRGTVPKCHLLKGCLISILRTLKSTNKQLRLQQKIFTRFYDGFLLFDMSNFQKNIVS